MKIYSMPARPFTVMALLWLFVVLMGFVTIIYCRYIFRGLKLLWANPASSQSATNYEFAGGNVSNDRATKEKCAEDVSERNDEEAELLNATEENVEEVSTNTIAAAEYLEDGVERNDDSAVGLDDTEESVEDMVSINTIAAIECSDEVWKLNDKISAMLNAMERSVQKMVSMNTAAAKKSLDDFAVLNNKKAEVPNATEESVEEVKSVDTINDNESLPDTVSLRVVALNKYFERPIPPPDVASRASSVVSSDHRVESPKDSVAAEGCVELIDWE